MHQSNTGIAICGTYGNYHTPTEAETEPTRDQIIETVIGNVDFQTLLLSKMLTFKPFFTFKNVDFFSNIFGTKRSPYSVIIFSSCPFPVNIPWQVLAITSKLDDDTFPGCSDFCPPHLRATVTSPAPPGRFQTDG